jgi:oligoxyloglucan reducing-end-specific cellobiohydrolase
VRIDDAAHEYGYVDTIQGDPRNFGRVYLGTGGRGIVYGDSPN